jgi:hypothetical protein
MALMSSKVTMAVPAPALAATPRRQMPRALWRARLVQPLDGGAPVPLGDEVLGAPGERVVIHEGLPACASVRHGRWPLQARAPPLGRPIRYGRRLRFARRSLAPLGDFRR